MIKFSYPIMNKMLNKTEKYPSTIITNYISGKFISPPPKKTYKSISYTSGFTLICSSFTVPRNPRSVNSQQKNESESISEGKLQ